MQCLKTRKNKTRNNRLVWEVMTLHPKVWLGQKKREVFCSVTVEGFCQCIWLWSSVTSMSYWLYFFHYFSCLKNCNKISRTLQRRSSQWTLTSHNRSWIWVKRTRASLLKTLTSSSTVLPLSALVSHSSELFFSFLNFYFSFKLYGFVFGAPDCSLAHLYSDLAPSFVLCLKLAAFSFS